MARKNARTTRTQAMLDDFRGSAHEAQMLAGVLTWRTNGPTPTGSGSTGRSTPRWSPTG